ncbi:MAG: T9SS type A sorting domain-containing protein, partial [Bacteroidales bacterium]
SGIVEPETTKPQPNPNMFSGAEELEMLVYPNPNDGYFTAGISADEAGTFTLQLISNLGVKVYELKELEVIGTIYQKIDVRDLKAGVYTLLLTNTNHSIQKKVVIQK